MRSHGSFVENEWYHCYSRGIDKRRTFQSVHDYNRFTELLYLANNMKTQHRSDLIHIPHKDIFERERTDLLVSIGAWCLMPNHFHLLLKGNTVSSISTFMQKITNGYTKYFNIKNERVGNLFVRPFRSKHVGTEDYVLWLTRYIHLNPIELVETGWKDGHITQPKRAIDFVRAYPYSSLRDYEGVSRPENHLLDKSVIQLLGGQKPLSRYANEIQDYCVEL